LCYNIGMMEICSTAVKNKNRNKLQLETLTFVRNLKGDVMQQVSLDVSRMGRFGYFTNGILAWGLTPEEYARGDEWHTQHAKSLGFTFISGVL
jgi:hypothetical protein